MPVSEQMPATAMRFGRAPGPWPFLGHAMALRRRPLALLDSLPARGDLVVFSPYILHHRPGRYPQPHRFDPARWLAPSPELRAPYLPFGAGATRCIEEEFGLAEATLILASMATRWNLAPEVGTTVSPAARAVLVPGPSPSASHPAPAQPATLRPSATPEILFLPNGRGARPHDQLPHRGGYAGLVHNRVMPGGGTAGSPPAAGDGAAG